MSDPQPPRSHPELNEWRQRFPEVIEAEEIRAALEQVADALEDDDEQVRR